MPLETTAFDASQYLDTPEAIAAFLTDAFQDGDAATIAHALGIVARAKGMTQLAKDSGLTRNSLYKALSAEGRPEFSTILKVVGALGVKLAAVA